MSEINILEWNIHQQGRKSVEIPMFIFDYISDEIDIVILLEINAKSLNINNICKQFSKRNYKVYLTNYKDCNCANDILVAVKLNNNIIVKAVNNYKAYTNSKSSNIDINTIPENLFLEVQIYDKTYVITAIRIKELKSNYIKRKEQMETLFKWINEISLPVIIVGDFNNLIENTNEQNWNIHILDEIIKGMLIRKTPTDKCSWGVSYYPDEKKFDGYIKEDHVLFSSTLANVDEAEVDYSWDFLENRDAINSYTIKEKNMFGQQNVCIPIGIPDHAILTIKFQL